MPTLPAQVVKATVWLADMQDFAAFNVEYRRHFPDGFPVRSTVEARLFNAALVEIEVQAWVGATTDAGPA
jgi:enamine deaminase RidA (YjgF/YER057c/UK114 family)